MRQFLENLNLNAPASNDSITAFENATGKKLPESYIEFLKIADGGEGFVGKAYVILWRLGDLITYHQGYKVEEYASGLLLFGSDGGGEAFGFDMNNSWRIVQIPFIPMDWDEAELVGNSFPEFLEYLQNIN